jgi:hypothetical protein
LSGSPPITPTLPWYREGPEGALAPHLRESSPSRRGRPRKGLERGPARIELRRIPGPPRINPARRGGGRGASQRWKGMQGKPIHPPQSSTRTRSKEKLQQLL